jgi:antitoxin MazE
MLTTIRKMGNSQGVLIPKPLLQQVGLTDQVELLIQGETLVIQKPKRRPREGWDEEGQKLLEMGEPTPVLMDFANEDDENLVW